LPWTIQRRCRTPGVERPGCPRDLLIAAYAEQADLKVLHYDADFERVAELAGQPTQWIVPRGSVS
jgi:predicted nucleic acid-binding protein